MTVRRIHLFPDSILSTPCKSVHVFDGALKHLIDDLKDTLHASPGVGIAAPQIGVSERVSVIDVSLRKTKGGGKPDKNHGFIVLINPKLIQGHGVQIPREGCLSVPNLLANVRRFQRVIVEAKDAEGNVQKIQAEDFEALALQHEIDHLEGTLFLDRVANLKTDIFRRQRPS